MMIPPLYGKLDQQGFFIFVACDRHYFSEFGKTIINSIEVNSSFGIHVHLYNPLDEQIAFCQSRLRVSVSYEYVPLEIFESAANKWLTVPEDPIDRLNYERILTSMRKSNDVSIQERIQRTYYACARFIRLKELVSSSQSLLAIDVDAIVRSNIVPLTSDYDFYIHHITGKKARFLAGGIYLTGSIKGYEFLTEYANSLQNNILSDRLYWGIDQDVLDNIVPKYNFGQLPMPYIDWEMGLESFIWTAKGKRKELEVFINEQKKYNF